MAEVIKKKPEYIIFVDTNILLDLYQGHNATLKTLQSLVKNRGRVILTYQVQTEFLKNRQRAIMSPLAALKNYNLPVPPFLRGTELGDSIKETCDKVTRDIKAYRDACLKLLASPTEDKVFVEVQRLFGAKSNLLLHSDTDDARLIEKRAEDRFSKGLPPRKKDDVYFGDALNWEWILECAARKDTSVIVVSRDGDFGHIHNDVGYLNDLLSHEFCSRVGQKAKVTLTPVLTEALEKLKIEVTPEEKAEEKDLIHSTIRSDILFDDATKEALRGLKFDRASLGIGSIGLDDATREALRGLKFDPASLGIGSIGLDDATREALSGLKFHPTNLGMGSIAFDDATMEAIRGLKVNQPSATLDGGRKEPANIHGDETPVEDAGKPETDVGDNTSDPRDDESDKSHDKKPQNNQ